MKRHEERIAELEKEILPQPAPVIFVKAGEPIPAVGKNVVIIIDDIPKENHV